MAIFNKKNLFTYFLITAIFVSSVLISVGAGYIIGWKKGNEKGLALGLASCKVCPPEDLDFSLFWKVWKDLNDRFYDPTKLDPRMMTYGAISGMVNSLNDPYTVFFNPQQTKEVEDEAKGTF